MIGPGGNIWAMPVPQCRCSASFGPKASKGLLPPQVTPVAGLFHPRKRARAEAGSCREPWPPCPAPSPGPLGGSRPRRGSGQGEPLKRFVPPRWRREWCRQRKERQRIVPRGFAAAPLFPGRKKQTAKGMGRSPPGDPWGRVPGPEGKGGVSSLPHTLGKALAVDGKVAGRCGRREDSERQAVGTAQPSF